MAYVVHASFQSFENFGARKGKCESSKNWIFRSFPNLNTIILSWLITN